MENKNENQAKEQTLEECFLEIETMIEALEQSDISLENAFFTYEKGMKKLKECNDKIEKVEQNMLILNEHLESL